MTIKQPKTKRISIDKLLPHPKNPRVISEEESLGLEQSLSRFGLVENLVWNESSGFLVGGHQRLDVLRKNGVKTVDVKVVNLDEKEELALLVALNSQAISGDWDASLEGILGEVLEWDAGAYSDLRFDQIEFVMPVEETGGEDTAPGELPKKPTTKLGDTWLLGNHRLRCGSCEDGGHEAFDLLVTDPPYGVSYENTTAARSSKTRSKSTITNDDLTPKNMGEFWTRSFTAIGAGAKNGASFYVTGPGGGELPILMEALLKSGLPPRHVLVWVKDRLVLGRADYHYQHEPIIYGWKGGASHRWFGGRKQTSVWEIARPSASDLHPTMKPVELYERAMANSSKPGDLVADPFAGSGTAFIAGENLGRRVYGTELSPAYCDVIVERWQGHTGKKATRSSG